jgi:putative transposase
MRTIHPRTGIASGYLASRRGRARRPRADLQLSMPNYVRARVEGGTYFFTLTTQSRSPVLVNEHLRHALREAIETTRARWPFIIDAWVLLPDHLHCLWTLPEGDADFSKRWSTLKRLTTQALGQTVWQARFWKHLIRDEADFQSHFNYIHWNPVKHELVQRAIDWPYSTFHRYLKQGIYTPDWCDQSPDLDLE